MSVVTQEIVFQFVFLVLAVVSSLAAPAAPGLSHVVRVGRKGRQVVHNKGGQAQGKRRVVRRKQNRQSRQFFSPAPLTFALPPPPAPVRAAPSAFTAFNPFTVAASAPVAPAVRVAPAPVAPAVRVAPVAPVAPAVRVAPLPLAPLRATPLPLAPVHVAHIAHPAPLPVPAVAPAPVAQNQSSSSDLFGAMVRAN